VEEATQDEPVDGHAVSGTCSLVLEGGAAMGDNGNYTVIFLAQLGGRKEFEIVVKEKDKEGGGVVWIIIGIVAAILLATLAVVVIVLKKRRTRTAGGDNAELQPSGSAQAVLPRTTIVCEVSPNNGRRKTEESGAGEEEHLLDDTKPGACAREGVATDSDGPSVATGSDGAEPSAIADKGDAVQKPPDLDRGISEMGDLCNRMEKVGRVEKKSKKKLEKLDKIKCSLCGKEFPQGYMKTHEKKCSELKKGNEPTIQTNQQVGPSFHAYREPTKKDDDDEDEDSMLP
jgi:hypothetical protein